MMNKNKNTLNTVIHKTPISYNNIIFEIFYLLYCETIIIHLFYSYYWREMNSVVCTLYSVLCTLYSVTGQPPDTHIVLPVNIECNCCDSSKNHNNILISPINKNREMSDETVYG